MSRMIVEAVLTWTGAKFERDIQVEVSEEGRITRAGPLGLPPTRTLDGQALLPGFVSAHSHAFQRALRGYGESFPEGEGSFWSWRESMYSLVEELDRERFYEVCLAAFREMLAAGITTVGEFHYLHHERGKSDYSYDGILLDAARDCGIRIVLLETWYRTGGVERSLAGPQLRFATQDLAEYWRQIERLTARIDPRRQSIGVAAHSIRAASPDEIAALYQEATRRGLVFHMHVEEQQREMDESRASYGHAPLHLLLDRLRISQSFSAVHCTQSEVTDLERFFQRGGNVCIAPLAEANLADGIPRGELMRRWPDQLCLGTDSNSRISMLEEMRWLEYAQRLATRSRGVFRDERGANASTLLRIATAGGARSLGVAAGAIEPGLWADFVAIDLSAPQLAGWTDETLLDSLIFGSDNTAIAATCVGGKWI